MVRSTFIGMLLLVATVAPQNAAAQRRTGSTEVSIIARVGTKSYTSRVPGTCQHEPMASIYDVPAALWMVRADGSDKSDIKRLSLTLWRPKSGGPDQVSVSLEAGSRTNRIDVNPRMPPVGAATVQLKPVGPGGKFELRGKDAKGTKVYLMIGCPTFTGIEAEGG